MTEISDSSSLHDSTRIIVITGLSGAGKTVALRALEDIGYFCIDNFPPQMFRDFFRLSAAGDSTRRVAVSIDVREKGFLDNVDASIDSLRKDYDVEVIFLEAERSVLLRRYKETRRPHPLSGLTDGDIQSALELEIEFLAPLKDLADRVIDTSSYTPHQLRSLITEAYAGAERPGMGINLISFGYKFGIPQHVDLLFDIRFLPNPHFVEGLRDLSGLDRPVRDYVTGNPVAKRLLEKLEDLIPFLITEYLKEGKTSLTIGVGCTGGRHRAPVIVEELRDYLSSIFDLEIRVVHREL